MEKLKEKFLSMLKIPTSSGVMVASQGGKNPISPVKPMTSIGIIITSFALTYLPIFPVTTTVTVVIGSELKEVLTEIETKFEAENSNINLDLKVQGSQDIISNFIQGKNNFIPTVLIPANGELINQLESHLQGQGKTDIFYQKPSAIAQTLLVVIAWEDRGKVLFPDGKFNWNTLENALKVKNWEQLGGKKEWGSFDFISTDPTRSNSGQLTLSLWAKNKLNQSQITENDINNSEVEKLFKLLKNSIYQPPRSTDILLQEFIVRGANGADVATVYESNALHRWLQTKNSQNQGYQIYYPNPNIETVVTGAIVKENVTKEEAKSAQKFINYLREKEQQIIFANYGFRPIIELDLQSLDSTPWSENIPNVEVNPSVTIQPSPNTDVIEQIKQKWDAL